MSKPPLLDAAEAFIDEVDALVKSGQVSPDIGLFVRQREVSGLLVTVEVKKFVNTVRPIPSRLTDWVDS